MLPATLNMKKDESNDKDENQIETKLEEIPKVEKVSQHISQFVNTCDRLNKNGVEMHPLRLDDMK